VPYEPIQQLDCHDGREFIDALSLTRDPFATGAWLFRGHGRLMYRLAPTVFRQDGNQEKIEHVLGATSDLVHFLWADGTCGYQVLREATMLLRFAEVADAGGLPLPGTTTATIQHLEALILDLKTALHECGEDGLNGGRNRAYVRPLRETWPTREATQLMALARHVGMPCRLLDWTPNPMMAAYFACADAVDSGVPDGERLCVWGMRDVVCKPISVNGGWVYITSLVRVLREGNRNMAAQRGAFTAQTIGEGMWTFDAPAPQLDGQILAVEHRLDQGLQTTLRHSLIKVTLDARHAAATLAFLRRHEITRVTMYPDYGSIMQEFSEDYRSTTLVLGRAQAAGFPL
jgi:hypothetical protein